MRNFKASQANLKKFVKNPKTNLEDLFLFLFLETTSKNIEIGGFLDWRPFFFEITARLAESCGPAKNMGVN